MFVDHGNVGHKMIPSTSGAQETQRRVETAGGAGRRRPCGTVRDAVGELHVGKWKHPTVRITQHCRGEQPEIHDKTLLSRMPCPTRKQQVTLNGDVKAS